MSEGIEEAHDATKRARARLADAGVVVLFEDNHVLGVSKPPGLLSQGAGADETSLPELLDAYRREAESKPGRAFVGVVHRLDRNVSGVLVVAKTSKAAGRLSAAFRDRVPGLEKTYLAWVAGSVAADRGRIVDRLTRRDRITRRAPADATDAREATLHYVVDGRGPRATRLLVTLETGFTHQIRAQLAMAEHPLLGDEKYGGPPGDRPALHARRLAFPHPVGGRIVTLEAPLPGDLVCLDRRAKVRPPVDGG